MDIRYEQYQNLDIDGSWIGSGRGEGTARWNGSRKEPLIRPTGMGETSF